MKPHLVLLALLGTAAPFVASRAAAESYIERKDASAIATIERALTGLDKDPALFDGAAIPPGADLHRVGALLDRLVRSLDQAARAWNDLSPAGMRRDDVRKLKLRLDALVAYRDALSPVYKAADRGAQNAQEDARSRDQTARMAGIKACTAFLHDLGGDFSTMKQFVDLSHGAPVSWETVETGAPLLAALDRTAKLCAKPEYADVDAGCIARGNRDELCAVAKRGPELVKLAAKNLARSTADHFMLSRNASNLAKNDGYLDTDHATTWAEYFSPKTDLAKVNARLAPVFAQTGVTDAGAEIEAKITTTYTELEAKVRELASTWPLPGAPCAGVGCAEAKQAIARNDHKAKLVALRQGSADWKIAKNDLDIPTARYKDLFALVQLPGEPFCQLRSWTARQSYAGGGRYASTVVTMGYVRWQACK